MSDVTILNVQHDAGKYDFVLKRCRFSLWACGLAGPLLDELPSLGDAEQPCVDFLKERRIRLNQRQRQVLSDMGDDP